VPALAAGGPATAALRGRNDDIPGRPNNDEKTHNDFEREYGTPGIRRMLRAL